MLDHPSLSPVIGLISTVRLWWLSGLEMKLVTGIIVTAIVVQDWMGACGGTMTAGLTSYVADETGEPVRTGRRRPDGNGNNMALDHGQHG